MRPGQNRRMRGRNNGGRKGPNPLTRSYESNGPDVKVRGTAQHVAEKYLQLARDAHSSGDPVMAESYLQHAEHYFRLIATAQAAQAQAQPGYVRTPGEADAEEMDEDDLGGVPDRFASPAERFPAPQPPQHQPQGFQPQPYQGGQDRQQDRGPRPERQPYQDRNQQSRFPRDNRNQRDNRQERFDNRNEFRQEGRQEGRQDQPRGEFRQDTRQEPRQEARQDRLPDNRPQEGRPEARESFRQPRESYQREQPQGREEDVGAAGLPAFITAPARAPALPQPEAEETRVAEIRPSPEAGAGDEAPRAVRRAPVETAENDQEETPRFPLRARRRRRVRNADGELVDPAPAAGEEPVAE